MVYESEMCLYERKDKYEELCGKSYGQCENGIWNE